MWLTTIGQYLDESNLDDTLINLDFIAEIYTVNGSPVSLDAVLATYGTIEEDGMLVDFGEVPSNLALAFIGDALANFLELDGWTLVFEVLDNGGAAAVNYIGMTDGVDDSFLFWHESGDPNFQYVWVYDDPPGGDYREEYALDPAASRGLHRYAVTRTPTELSISQDGNAARTSGDTNPVNPWGVTSVAIGGMPGDEVGTQFYVRSLMLLTPQSAAQLAALSEV